VKRRKTSGEASDTTPKLEETPGEDSASASASDRRPASPSPSTGVADSTLLTGNDELEHEYQIKSSQTDLETSLPAIETDEHAIREYEASQTEKNEHDEETESGPGLHVRLRDGVWQKGKSSIYVDAFNLALETVLDEESHLFDASELCIFDEWKGLAYESQYLYDLSILSRKYSYINIPSLDMCGFSFARLPHGIVSIAWAITLTYQTYPL
jgi:Fanconi-associated nuclease 1